MTNQTTGTIEGTDGFTLQFNEIQQIYMIVEWWDVDKKEDLSEEIILFERTVDEPSFLTE